MGTTSEKLTYLNTTKQELKQAINNIGGDITNETTFREYAQELDNIYDNLPKTTGEDTNLSLNTLKGKMNIIPKGDTSQDGTPTPDTPIDIEVVTGNQEVKVENVNLLDYTKFVKGRINSTTGQIEYASNTTNITTTENTISFTTSQAWNSGIASEFIPIQQGNYIYSIKSATLKANVYIDLYDKDQNFISRLGNKVINANEQTTWQVTISNTSAKYIRLHYEMGYADTVTLTETQLEKGTTATPYKPHKEQTQIVSLGDIELSKIGNYQDYFYKTSGKNKFSSVVELGSIVNGYGTLEDNSNCVRSKEFIEVKPNTQYTISNNMGYANYVYIYDVNKTYITELTGASYYNTHTFTTTSIARYIKVRSIAGSVQNNLNVKYMLNIGSTALPYEPYGSGIWYKKEQIGKVVLNGSETGWNTAPSIVANTIRVFVNDNSVKNSGNESDSLTYVMSDYFKPLSWIQIYNTDTTSTSGVANWNSSSPNAGRIVFRVPTSIASSLDTFKTWLSTHNTEVRYVLATPNDIEITNTTLIEQLDNLEKLKSYNGVTNINCSGNLSAILGVSAIKGES